MDSLSLSIRHLKGNPGPGAYYRDFQVGLQTNESRKRERLKAKAKAKAKARIKKEREEAEAATQRQIRRIAAAKEAEAAAASEFDGPTADVNISRPSTAGNMTLGATGSLGGSLSRPQSVDSSLMNFPRSRMLRSRQSQQSSSHYSSSLSSVFTVLDDTQSALGNFAAQVEWQLGVNEKPRPRYVADVDPKDGYADGSTQSDLALEDLKPLSKEEWDALYPPPPEPKRDARYYMKKKPAPPAPEPDSTPEPEAKSEPETKEEPAPGPASELVLQQQESEPRREADDTGAEDEAAAKIQAVFRGRQSRRYGKGGRAEALSSAKEALAAAEAAFSKEEAEAIAAEAEAAREEAEAVAAEAAFAKEEAEALAAEADAAREEAEAIQAEADAACVSRLVLC